MWSCANDSVSSIPLSVQQAEPFLNADIAKLFRIGVLAPSIWEAAFLVNRISRCVISQVSESTYTSFTSPIFSPSAKTSSSINSLNFNSTTPIIANSENPHLNSFVLMTLLQRQNRKTKARNESFDFGVKLIYIKNDYESCYTVI